MIERFAPGRSIASSTTIAELGLSSLERVELMMALEESLQVTIDESRFAAAVTVGDLESLARPLASGEYSPDVPAKATRARPAERGPRAPPSR